MAEAGSGSMALSTQELIKAVACAVKIHSMNNLGGIDKIEELKHAEVDDLPITGTVFAVMADKARVLGIEVDDTVGGVITALYGLERGSALVREYAHEIGCNCHGDYISPDIAAARILNVGKLIVS